MSFTASGLVLGSEHVSTLFSRRRAEILEVDSARSSWSSRALVGRREHPIRMMATGGSAASGTELKMEMKTAERPRTLTESLESMIKEGQLPARYHLKEAERPEVEYDEWSGSADIPVLDMSLMATDRAKLSKQMGDASKEYGFFQIVNHGLSLEDLKAMESLGFGFFALPGDQKSRAQMDGQNGFFGDNLIRLVSSLHWAEALAFTKTYLDEMVHQIWPEGNESFRNTVIKFCAAVERMNVQILELLAESLGIETDHFSQHMNSKKTMYMRWNYYPACIQPSLVLGAGSHTDGNSITILQQDSVGGLQIQKDGKWIGIKPVEGALVINIGDVMHAWTNGIFKSVLHRSAVNKRVHRLSLAVFLSADPQLSISAPDELVDEEHPRIYRPFNALDYLNMVMKLRDESGGAERDGLMVLNGLKI